MVRLDSKGLGRGRVGFVVALLFAATPNAAVAESNRTLAEELIEIMYGSGTIDDVQYRRLLDKARAEEEQREADVQAARRSAEEAVAVAAAPAVNATSEDWDFKWSNGFTLERSDGAFQFKFGGRIQNDWAAIGRDDALEEVFQQGTGTEFRRARLFFRGTLYEQLYFKAQYEFANTEIDQNDLYIGLRDLGWLGQLQVGHAKEPFSLEYMTSSKYVTFMERALPNVFVPQRNSGFAAQNTLRDKRMLWEVGVYRNTVVAARSFSDDGDYHITARLSGVPIYADEGSKVLHLGVAYSHQFRGGPFSLRYRQRPESHLADRIVDTQAPDGSNIPADGIDLVNVEAAWVWGPASVQAEYMHAFVDGDDVSDTNFWGSYIEASYFLTGEHRNYQLGKGRFGRVRPHENFNSHAGHWGAWQVATRFSYLDLNDEFVKGGKVWDVTLGLNWYLYPNARIMLNYIHSRVKDRLTAFDPSLDGDANIGQMRFEIDF